ncbi:hypothetical protein MKEN_01069400 [Mycena kentingensis (nom. inval.)]|nr:hypothetical protein MKEN_01069400 [Mycena kentingensis (nom. inval.)]
MADSARDGPGHPLSLKVMRVSRPSLAGAWQPFYSSSPSFSAHSTASILSLQGKTPLPGHPKTLRDLHLSELLQLPASFGNIQLGETFSSCLCVNNEAPQLDIEGVALKVEMQTATSKVLLGEFGGPDTRLKVGDALEDAVVHHEVKELGQHVLACTVSYRVPALRADDGNEPAEQSFRKFYKFAVTNPLSVKTKVHTPRSPSALLSRTEREKVFLEVHIQNLTTDSLWFERMRFECAEGWDVQDANIIDVDKAHDDAANTIFSGSMQPQDMRQYIYILSRQSTSLAPTVNAPGSVIPLGRLDISWRSSYGEPGRLLTSMLSRKIPLISVPAIQPAPALPPYLKRTSGPPRPHSPQLSMSRPDSPTSIQRPGSPFRNRPPSTMVARGQTPPPHMAATSPPSDVEVSLLVRDLPHDSIRLETPFKMGLTLVVLAPVAAGRRRSLIFAVQHLQPPRTSVPVPTLIPPPPVVPEAYSPRTAGASSPGFSTPSPRVATFNVQLAQQKLAEISVSSPTITRRGLVDVALEGENTWTLPPPFFEGADELNHTRKPGAVFCGASAIILQPIEIAGTDSDGKQEGAQDFELQYMPLMTGLSTVGGLRAILLEDKNPDDEERLHMRAEPKTLKQWDVVGEIWVSS